MQSHFQWREPKLFCILTELQATDLDECASERSVCPIIGILQMSSIETKKKIQKKFFEVLGLYENLLLLQKYYYGNDDPRYRCFFAFTSLSIKMMPQ